MQIEIDALDVAIYAVLEGVDDPITLMSTMASMIYNFDERFDWVGFYRAKSENMLEIGPYQGSLGCLYIPFGKGVCGHVAAKREGIIVDDVESFEGHIACSSHTKSEMVLPVLNENGELLAVLDFDSNRPSAFNMNDFEYYSKILNTVFAKISLAQMRAPI